MARPVRDARGRSYAYHGRHYASFRAGRYRWPAGRGYHRFYVHQRFPRAYWRREYYITDYGYYGVDAPPADAQWMRYGPDLVLVDLNTGNILNVVPGMFEDSDQGPDDQGGPPPDDGSGQDQGPPPDQPPPDLG